MSTVLFVDDEESILNAIRRLFADDADIHAMFAINAEEALHIIRHEDVHVVVSDKRMPGVGGIELLERVRLLSPRTVRILMTAYADLQTAIDTINRCEAFRFVTKPWDNDKLKEILHEALDRSNLIRELACGDEGAIRSIAQTIELKDPYTRGHCDRVAELASALARRHGLRQEAIDNIRRGSWLHDCGKIGVPEMVLNLTRRLDEAEMEIIRNHPLWGADVARQAGLSSEVVNIILHHHEKFDGSGYPSGLKQGEIPLEARIVAIADVFDSLHTDRPYHKMLPIEEILPLMESMGDSHLDPQLLKLFMPIARETGEA